MYLNNTDVPKKCTKSRHNKKTWTKSKATSKEGYGVRATGHMEMKHSGGATWTLSWTEISGSNNLLVTSGVRQPFTETVSKLKQRETHVLVCTPSVLAFSYSQLELKTEGVLLWTSGKEDLRLFSWGFVASTELRSGTICSPSPQDPRGHHVSVCYKHRAHLHQQTNTCRAPNSTAPQT